jgi:hypothetical protein
VCVRIGVGPPFWYCYRDVLLLIERTIARVSPLSRASPGATGRMCRCFCSCFRRAPQEGEFGRGRERRARFFAHFSTWGQLFSCEILDSGSSTNLLCSHEGFSQSVLLITPPRPSRRPVTGPVTAAVQRKGGDDRSIFGGCYRDRWQTRLPQRPNEPKDNTFRSSGSNITSDP